MDGGEGAEEGDCCAGEDCECCNLGARSFVCLRSLYDDENRNVIGTMGLGAWGCWFCLCAGSKNFVGGTPTKGVGGKLIDAEHHYVRMVQTCGE